MSAAASEPAEEVVGAAALGERKKLVVLRVKRKVTEEPLEALFVSSNVPKRNKSIKQAMESLSVNEPSKNKVFTRVGSFTDFSAGTTSQIKAAIESQQRRLEKSAPVPDLVGKHVELNKARAVSARSSKLASARGTTKDAVAAAADSPAADAGASSASSGAAEEEIQLVDVVPSKPRSLDAVARASAKASAEKPNKLQIAVSDEALLGSMAEYMRAISGEAPSDETKEDNVSGAAADDDEATVYDIYHAYEEDDGLTDADLRRRQIDAFVMLDPLIDDIFLQHGDGGDDSDLFSDDSEREGADYPEESDDEPRVKRRQNLDDDDDDDDSDEAVQPRRNRYGARGFDDDYDDEDDANSDDSEELSSDDDCFAAYTGSISLKQSASRNSGYDYTL